MDMFLATTLFSIRFADDTNLVSQGNDKEIMQAETNEELKKLFKWFCKNKLTLHPDKSRYIVYTKEKNIEILLGEKKLMRCGYEQQEEGVKFLGVLIDENLDWKLHTNQVRKKIAKGNYLLWRYKNKLTDNMKKTIYESFIKTHLTYCLPVWGAKKTNNLKELKKNIKKTWTKIGPRYQHTNEKLKEYRILKLEDELRIAEVKIIWRWIKNRLPRGLREILVETQALNLRNRKFNRPRNWKHDSISYRLASRAIKEIKDIEIARSRKGLAKKYKNTILLTEYNSVCRKRNCLYCATQNNIN